MKIKRIRYEQIGAAMVNTTKVAIMVDDVRTEITIKLQGTEASVYNKEGLELFSIVSNKLITTKIYLRRRLDKQGLQFIGE